MALGFRQASCSTEIQNGRHGSTSILLWVQKLKKSVRLFFSNFNTTFLATWGCASDFFKDATKIQNGRQRSTPNYFVGAKTLKLKVRNYSNFTIAFPTI